MSASLTPLFTSRVRVGGGQGTEAPRRGEHWTSRVTPAASTHGIKFQLNVAPNAPGAFLAINAEPS